MALKNILLFIIILVSSICYGQIEITGKIVDKATNRPLPFVNILYSSSSNLGTTSDLDGRFTIHSARKVNSLEFSFMGYKTQKLNIDDIKELRNINIKLEAQAYTLPEAEVFAEENPAHRIIKQAVRNRKYNNPKSLKTFRYETYSKMFFTFDLVFYQNGDTMTSDEYQFGDTLSSLDSNIQEINKFRDDQYLFLMESVTEKKYKRPGKVSEKVLASRVSGFENPVFTLIGSQLQSFTIYSDYISVAGIDYLSPLSKNSISKYLFIIEDTLINSASDTTYTLSYRPRKDKNFEGLKGIIQINTNGFAVENFSTMPTRQGMYTVTIRQKYEFVNDSAWFPTQLDADFEFNNILSLDDVQTDTSNSSGPNNSNIYGKAKTYIKKIEIGPKIRNREFSHIALDYDKEANIKDSVFWSQYRIDTITQKELNTYRVIDSIGKEIDFEKQLKLLSYIVNGQIPFGPVSLRLDKIINYNVAEGYRLGLGLTTNEKVLKNVTLGAYGAYGFKDKKAKYGGNLKINLRDYYDSHVELKYQNDISEIGGFTFLETNNFLNPETYRDFLIKNIVYEESGEIAVEARFLYYLKTRFFAKFSNYNINNPFYELAKENNEAIKQFQIPEVGFKMRYAYHEHYVRTPMGIQALKTKYPVLFFNVSKSIIFDQYTIDYTRIWAKVEKRFTIRNAGVSSVSLQSGYAFGELPYNKLFNGHGSYYPFTVVALNSFGTMRLNEFISDRFMFLFYRHSFGKLLLKTERMQPELSFVQNMGWGDLGNADRQLGVSTKTMDQGFFESGFVVDNIFNYNFFEYGFGVYYRYGPYAFTNELDNFGFKFSFKLSLGSL